VAAGFEGVDRARARAAQAAMSPAIWYVFPAMIERRLKIFRCAGKFVVFIFAAACQSSHSRGCKRSLQPVWYRRKTPPKQSLSGAPVDDQEVVPGSERLMGGW
jgi:hypothetical protein